MKSKQDMKWFRVYGELNKDAKIRKIARLTGEHKQTIVGCWVTILCLASDSPVRGKLYLGKDDPFDYDDLLDEMGMRHDVFEPILQGFIDRGMICTEDGIFTLCNWDKRQYKSDNSTERVRKHRAKQERIVTETKGNVSVTPPDTDTDTDTDTPPLSPPPITEKKSKRANGGGDNQEPLQQLPPEYQHLLAQYQKLFPQKSKMRQSSIKGKVFTKFKARWKDKDFREHHLEALEKAGKSDFCQGRGNWQGFDLKWFLHNDDNWDKCYSGNYDNKGSQPIQENDDPLWSSILEAMRAGKLPPEEAVPAFKKQPALWTNLKMSANDFQRNEIKKQFFILHNGLGSGRVREPVAGYSA